MAEYSMNVVRSFSTLHYFVRDFFVRRFVNINPGLLVYKPSASPKCSLKEAQQIVKCVRII
jgi:hypothetical protein